MPRAVPRAQPQAGPVLARATLRAADTLGLNQKALSRLLGVSEATVSRLLKGRPLEPESKEGELALLFIRLFRSLDTLVGGDRAAASAWLRAHNHHLQGVPGELVFSVQGLVHVVEYLDALRGKL